MTEFREDPAAFSALLEEAGTEAVEIAAHRVVDDAKPLVRSLRTKPPGRKEWPYSLPAGRLRESIHYVVAHDVLGVYADVKADVPLGYFRNIGGTGHAAYAATGKPRGDNPAIGEALLGQIGRPIP